MIRTLSLLKIHTPLISWLFVGLELILLSYQIFRFYTVKNERSNWAPIMILLLLLVWNCTMGAVTELMLLVFINTVALMITVLVMLLPFFLPYPKDKLPETPELPVNPEDFTDFFIANCKRHNLTPRETEIVILIRKGYKNKEIADELHISEKTVESHLQHIYDKVGERSKFALISKLNQ